jgi:hypothetical protein
MHAVRTRIIRWLILWIVRYWVNISVLPWSLYAWITSLNFSYASDVLGCLISFTNLKLKIRTSRETFSMMINSNTRLSSRSFISLRLEFSNVEVEVKTRAFLNWFECGSSSWRKTMSSAKFWYRSGRRLVRVDIVIASDWSDDCTFSGVDWTFSSIDSMSLIDSIRNDLITVLRKSVDSDDKTILQV